MNLYALRIVPLIPAGTVADISLVPLGCHLLAQLEREARIELALCQGWNVTEKTPTRWETDGLNATGCRERWQFEIVSEPLILN